MSEPVRATSQAGFTETYAQSPEQQNYDTILDQALTAWSANKTFLAIASPTAAQNTAQAKALTKQMNGLIRVLLNKFDGTD